MPDKQHTESLYDKLHGLPQRDDRNPQSEAARQADAAEKKGATEDASANNHAAVGQLAGSQTGATGPTTSDPRDNMTNPVDRPRILTPTALFNLARQAGATAAEAHVLAAIAMAESSGRVDARSFDNAHGHGLWQIDDRYHKFDKAKALSDPLYNAKLAVQIMRDSAKAGKDPYKPWATYNNHAYEHYLGPNGGGASAVPATAAVPASAATPATAGAPTGWGGSVAEILNYAAQFLGVPYKWGGNDLATGVDCSGLVQQVFKRFGINLPRVSADQARAGQQLTAAQAQPGDLVSWDLNGRNAGADHIGIYLGNGQMLVGPKTGDVIKIQPISAIKGNATFTRVIPPGPATTRYKGMTVSANGTYAYMPKAGNGGTITAPAVGVAPADPEAVNKALEAAGFTRNLLATDPGLKATAEELVRSGITDPQEIERRIAQTDWWKKRTAAQRVWDEANADPTKHKDLSRSVEVQRQAILAQATKLGIPISPLAAHDLAVLTIRNGLTDEEVAKGIGQKFTPKAGVAYGGTVGETLAKLRQTAADYNVAIPEGTLAQWAGKVATGATTAEQYDAFIKQEAEKKYPHLKAQLDAGFTVSDLSSQFKAEMAKTLELDPLSIKTDDPLIQRAMQWQDPKSAAAAGKPAQTAYTTMPMYEYQNALRADPRWLKTNNARDSLLGTANDLLKDWGLAT